MLEIRLPIKSRQVRISLLYFYLIFSSLALWTCSENQPSSETKTFDDYELSFGDYPYNDIGFLSQISDPNICKLSCSAQTACVGFVYNVFSRDCIFKSKMEHFKPSSEWQSFRRLSTGPSLYTEHGGLDFPGHDLYMLTGVSPDHCKMKCSEQTSCVGFVYNPGGSYCHLKSQFASPGVFTSSWITYAKAGVTVPIPSGDHNLNYPFIDNIDFPGHDIEALMSATRQQCAERCNSLYDCVGFVYQKAMNYCHLKKYMMGTGSANQSWTAYFKEGHSNPEEPSPNPNPPPEDCIAIQVLAGKNLSELTWRRDQLIQSGYDAYITQIPGTDIFRLRVRASKSNVSILESHLISYFGYETWITSCD